MEGIKFDGEKLKWHLVDWNFWEAVCRVLMFGAKKYTKEEDVSWETFVKLANVLNVGLGRGSVEDCVKIAMTKFSKAKILNIGNNSLLIQRLGQNYTETECENINKNIGQTIKEGTVLRNSSQDCLSLVSLLLNTRNYAVEDVLSAAQKTDCISTTVTLQDGSEMYYVVNATKVSDCLMTVLNFWKEHLSTCNNIEIENNKVVFLGKDNWKKVPNRRQRYVDAMLRHAIAYAKGEKQDPECGESHLACIGCNIMFLFWMDLTNDKENNENKENGHG